jgi:hypothetical protein
MDDDAPSPLVLPEIDPNISAELKNLFDRGLLGDGLPPVMRTSRAAQAFQQAFDMIGGIPRLALWADQNPTKFFTLFSKLVPATAQIEQKTEIKVTLDFMTAERAAFLQNNKDQVRDDQILAPTPIRSLPQ